MLVGGARETPGSAAAGVGGAAAAAAAAGVGAASAVRVGSDSKESPISASTNGLFEIPKERHQNKPQKNNQNNQLSHREEKASKNKVQFKSNPVKIIYS